MATQAVTCVKAYLDWINSSLLKSWFPLIDWRHNWAGRGYKLKSNLINPKNSNIKENKVILICKHLDIYSKLLDCDIWTIRLYKFKFFQIMIPVGRLRTHFGGGDFLLKFENKYYCSQQLNCYRYYLNASILASVDSPLLDCNSWTIIGLNKGFKVRCIFLYE